MKVVIPGGSGQVGAVVARHLTARGDDVVVLTRCAGGDDNAAGVRSGIRSVAWDGRTVESHWVRELEGADVVFNLAGRSVDCRYTARNRAEIMDSRVDSTRAIGAAIASLDQPPSVWLQASTATIYAHRYDTPNDEATGVLGGDEPDVPSSWKFSLEVARAWEGAAMERDLPSTRRVLLRSAMTMSPDRGGVFDLLLGLVRRGLGGTCGHGRQFMSWVHDVDFCRAIDWLIEREDFDGPVIVAAPNPLPNAEFLLELRKAWGTRIGLPAARWMLEVGSFFLRTETELILKSRRVVPGRLLESGFTFEFPQWPDAAVDLCARWRSAR